MSEEIMGYDEDKAVEFIRAFLPAEIRDKYTDDDILFVVDCIWDYYESRGCLNSPPNLRKRNSSTSKTLPVMY